MAVATQPEWPTLETFARRPRDALMWVPRAADVARIRAALAVALRASADAPGSPARAAAVGPRVVDVGAGTGLLARLLGDGRDSILAVDPLPPRVRYHPVALGAADGLPGPYDAAIVSWMEAGQDYRQASARLAPVIVNAYDVEGGCGVMGAVDLAPFGFVEAASWRTPSFEDALFAIEHRGALRRRGYPGNRVDVLTRDPSLVPALREAVETAKPGGPLPWEPEMDRLRL